MTEEIKNEEVKACPCCKCCEKLKEFIFKALIVYVGVTLAIITSANVLKPKCPFARMMKPPMGIERQLPPPVMNQDFGHRMDRHQPPVAPHKFKAHKQRMDIKVNKPERK